MLFSPVTAEAMLKTFISHSYYSNFSIDLTVEFSKCYLLGQLNMTMLQTVTEDRCHWNHIQIISNGDTDDYCVHKCISLGLSWL